MRKYIIILILFFFTVANLFGQNQIDFLNQKSLLVSDIIAKITGLYYDSVSSNKIILTGLIDTRTKNINIENGFAYNGLSFSTCVKDTQLIKALNQKYKNNNYLFTEYNQDNSNRNNIINSTYFFNRDSCIFCSKLYLEIASPIDMWENLIVYNILKRNQSQDTLFFDNYYTKEISIPVFVYSLVNGKSSKANYLLIYKIEDNNKIVFRNKIIL